AVPRAGAGVLPGAPLRRRDPHRHVGCRADRGLHLAPVPPFIVALVVPLLALVGLFLMHWALGLVVLPFVALVASVPSWLLRRAEEQGQAMRQELGELGANVVDVVQGVREVATTGSGLRFLERIGQQHQRLARVSVAHGRRSGLEQGATDALTAFAMIA